MNVNVIECRLNFNSESKRFKLAETSSSLVGKGLYSYQWIVDLPEGNRKVLCGVSESMSRRLSSYIAEFNRDKPKSSNALHPLVRNLENRVTVRISGPYDKMVDAKQLETKSIKLVPKEQRLNATNGGNGGGAWSQYDDLPPSQGSFCLQETPKKYYPFKRKGDHIAPQLTPSANTSGVYKLKRIDENATQYVGMSTHVSQRTRSHASKASRHPEVTKIAQALAECPEKFVIGIFPSTQGATPRTLRSAERYHIDRLKPELNSNRGGGGPTVMRKRKTSSLLKEEGSSSAEEPFVIRPPKKRQRQHTEES